MKKNKISGPKKKSLWLQLIVGALLVLAILLSNQFISKQDQKIFSDINKASSEQKENNITQINNQNGTIFVVGGNQKDPTTSRTTAIKTAEFYNLKTKKWTNMPSMYNEHASAAVVANANKLYVFGGAEGNIWGGTTVLEEFDPITNQWTIKNNMPRPRFFAQAIALAGKIYVLGGMDDGTGADRFVDVYDPNNDSWESAPALPTHVKNYYSQRCAAARNKIYCPGLGEHSYTLVFDPSGNAWTELPTQNRTNLLNSFWTSNGENLYGVYLSNSNDIFIYNPDADTITKKSAGNYIHPSYQGFTVLMLGDELFLVGGEFTNGSVKDVYGFNLSSSSAWRKITPLNFPRTLAGAVALTTNYTGEKIEGGSIGGIITKNGIPVSGRNIKLEIKGDFNSSIFTQTDSAGKYNFSSLDPGTYEIAVEDEIQDSGPGTSYKLPVYKGKQEATIEKNLQIDDYNFETTRPF